MEDPVISLEETTSMLLQRLRILIRKRQDSSDPRKRIMIALAGVPGSGKSTVSSAVLRAAEARDSGVSEISVFPMVCYPLPFPFLLISSLQ